jgi:pyridoxine 4-dehydrogenase
MCKGAVPIPGAKDLAQAKENLGAMGWRLSSAEVEELDRASKSIRKGGRMVQNIFQTK